MNIRVARLQDVSILAKLEQQFLQDELVSASSAMQGQAFSTQELTTLVNQHYVVIAEKDNQIVGYVIAGSWAFFATWPIYRGLLKRLPDLTFEGQTLSEKNSCQYGPIWIKRSHRGQGIFEALVAKVRQLTRTKYTAMLTFIAEDNQVSYAAHTGKGAMQVVDYYTFENRDYYVLLG